MNWMSLDLIDGKSTLVQVMAWWQQAITWANVDPDLCRYMAPLGQIELNKTKNVLALYMSWFQAIG